MREAKKGFGLIIDTARTEPMLIETRRHSRVTDVSVEEYEWLNGAAPSAWAYHEGHAAD
ncbi:type II toxin-antitoxin system Phd/YefM family antitoxin [Acidiphilium sp. JA12-A1]|uniref:type II toxin-antitoxin system Phd/YefM family antitoxin n=1 Tax=Acidiphilium sp. JA12-A1 TaxID=1464546 RepID=UPI001F07D2E1|nr:type II toxin-antitoxin system Phd/YefM family antitoxin [Acidiphilium sp. JA12-A1]